MPPNYSRKTIRVRIGDNCTTVLAIVTHSWVHVMVGVHVRLNYTGSPVVRALLKACAERSIERNSYRILNADMHGMIYNIIANRRGVRNFKITQGYDKNGDPSHLELSALAKPFQVGQVFAILLALLYHNPGRSDLNYPSFRPLTRDFAHVQWGFMTLSNLVTRSVILMAITNKEKSIRDNWARQLLCKYRMKVRKPKKKGTAFTSALEDEYKLYLVGESTFVHFPLAGFKDVYSALFLALMIGKPVGIKDQNMTFSVRPHEERYVIRRIRTIARSRPRITRMSNAFINLVSNKVSKKKMAVAVSAASVAAELGLPREYVNALAGSKDFPCSRKISEDLAKLF